MATVPNPEEEEYKFYSTAATLAESLLMPLNKTAHRVMLEQEQLTYTKFDKFIKRVDNATSSFLCFITKPALGLVKLASYIARKSVLNTYSDLAHSLAIISEGFTLRQQELEDFFKKNGVSSPSSWVFSLENRKILNDTLNYIDSNFTELKSIPISKIILYFKCYGKVQKIARRSIPPQVIHLTRELKNGVKLLNQFSKFSVGVYGSGLAPSGTEESPDKKENFKKFCGLTEDNVVLFDETADRFTPAFSVVVSPDDHSIVLAIRGTAELFDAISDLNADELRVQLKDPNTGEVIVSGDVHIGIYNCAERISGLVRSTILALFTKHPDYQLVVCGHSLGAATAALVSLIWMSDKDIMKRGFIGLGLAPPAVVDATLNKYLKKHFFAAVYGDDLVPRFSEGSIRDLTEVIKYFHSHEERVEKCSCFHTKSVKSSSPEEAEYLDIYKEIKRNCNNFKMVTPGNVLLNYRKGLHIAYPLLRKGDEEVASAFIENEFLQEFIFDDSIITDHSGLGYKAAIEQVISFYS